MNRMELFMPCHMRRKKWNKQISHVLDVAVDAGLGIILEQRDCWDDF